MLENFQTFYLSEPELPQIKVPQDLPQDPVLWPAFITTRFFWTYPVVWDVAWFSPEVLQWSWGKLWDMMVLSHSTSLRSDCWPLETQPGHTVLEVFPTWASSVCSCQGCQEWLGTYRRPTSSWTNSWTQVALPRGKLPKACSQASELCMLWSRGRRIGTAECLLTNI